MRVEPSYELAYIESYDQNNSDRTLAGGFLKKSHSCLEKTLPETTGLDTVLEIGAGSGHHYPHVKHPFTQYIMTDGSLDMLEIAKKKFSEEIATKKVKLEAQDATAITYDDNSVDRLIATHVLEHLPDPVNVLKEWNRVVRPGGLISIVLPCDPGFLWRMGRHLGPRRNAKKLGIEYDYLQAVEHVNAIYNLVVFMRYHFETLTESWYPAKISVPDLNLFYICHIKTSQENEK